MSYHLKRYHRRRQGAIAYLGGKCVVCGATENLELDHIDPSKKEIELAKLWGVAVERYWKEIEKCQLLCKSCHIDKTLTNGDNGKFHVRCGTYTGYRRGCRCDECKAAERKQRKNWKRK